MSVISELEKQYFEIDDDYAIKEFASHAKGHFRKEQYWRRKRELNTHAYFLFVFTRLEDHVRVQSSDLIDQKQSSIIHWKTRSVWEITDKGNLPFKKRTSLLTQRGQADYNIIVQYYNDRNSIAHGGIIPGITLAINMIDVFNNMKRFHKILKR